MFYIKTHLNDNATLITELTDRNVFTRCPICGKEFPVNLARICHDAPEPDSILTNTDVVCDECGEEIKNRKFDPADYIDEILDNDSLCTTARIAEDYGMSEPDMLLKLVHMGILVPEADHWAPSKIVADREYVEMRKCPRGIPIPLWTQKGRLFLYDLLKHNGVLPNIEKNVG